MVTLGIWTRKLRFHELVHITRTGFMSREPLVLIWDFKYQVLVFGTKHNLIGHQNLPCLTLQDQLWYVYEELTW